MSNYKITFSPDLKINVEDFVAAWNDEPDCRAVAEAQLETSVAAVHDPISATAIAILGTIALSVAANTVYDLVKKASFNKNLSKNLEDYELLDFKEIPQSDGSKLLVIFVKQDKD